MKVIPIGPDQIRYICDLLDQPQVVEYCDQNRFLRDFRVGVRYDICRKQVITDRQLFQVRKISDITGQCWRLII